MTERAETVLRLAAFAAGLAVLAAVAALVGRASGIEVEDNERSPAHDMGAAGEATASPTPLRASASALPPRRCVQARRAGLP